MRELKTVKGHIKELLSVTHYKSIKAIQKENPTLSRKEIEEWLLDKYNSVVKTVNNNEKQLKKQLYKENVIEYIGNYEGFYDVLKGQQGKSMIVVCYDKKRGNIVRQEEIEIPVGKDFIDWYKEIGVWILRIDSEKTLYSDYPNLVVYLYEGSKNINAKTIKQYFKEGSVNCLLKPINVWAENCLENSKSDSAKKRYNAIINKLKKIENEIGDNGVDENAMLRVSNDIQVDISVEKPIIVGDNKYVIETKANKKALKHFGFRNTKIDHVDLNEYVYLSNIEEVETRDKLYKIKEKLEEDGVYHEITRDLKGISGINTLMKTWRITNKFMDFINEMEIETGLNECYIDDIDDKDLSKFVKNGTHYNATIDFVKHPKRARDIKHIDMKNAYANYKHCNYYDGFLGKITDWRKTDRIEGVGLYQINNLIIGNKLEAWNKKLRIYFNDNIYPSPELKWLKDNGATFDITYGCWGVKVVDFDMNNYDFLFEKYDKIKGYAKYVGMCDSHRLEKRFICYGDEALAKTLDNVTWYANNEITLKYPKKHNYHLGHFTSFITSYQRIQMMEELIYMDIDKLVRVCVDGIYYKGEHKIVNSLFRVKDDMTFENIAGDSYVSNIIDVEQIWECGEYKANYGKELYIGEGGNGKTHKNLLDKGLIRALYIAPSWKLAEKKRVEYGCHSEVWANILTTDPEKYGSIKRRYNVFIIDEVSMMTEGSKNYIFEKFDNVKLIFCGDIGYQAPPFSLDDVNLKPVEITKDGFDMVYEEKINYRYKCSVLKSLIKDVREMISYSRPDFEINNYVKSKLQKISLKELEKTYNQKDMILTRTHIDKDKYTEMFKHINKWYVTKNTRVFKNGMIIYGDKPDTTCELRHAYTIHSIQGETAEEKLFIHFEKNYDSRLLYTAVSRARRLEQIFMIV
jgi:nitrogen regulatory protein PII